MRTGKPLLTATLLFALTLPFQSLAAPSTVFGPQKYSSGLLSSKQSTASFNAQANTNGVINIVNGDGSDIVLAKCAGNIIAKLKCEIQNLAKNVYMDLTRPNVVEISLNNKVIVTINELPQTKGKLSLPFKALANNSLKIKVGKIIPSQSLSVEVKAETGTVNVPPVARFSFSPNGGIAPELISFSALTSSDSDGTIASYVWDFGDGTVGSGSLVTHQYLSAGTFNVKLTVTDNRGAVGILSQAVGIRVNQLPMATFTHQSDTGLGDLRLSVDASASIDSDGSIVEYRWNFGDGSPDIVGTDTSFKSREYLFGNPGSYVVRLTVKDNKGGLSTSAQTIEIKDLTPPVISLSAPTEGAVITATPISVAGLSNEKINSAMAQLSGESNDVSLNVSADGKSFSGSIPISSSGNKTLVVTVVDLGGNPSSVSLSFTANFLVPPLADLKITDPSSNVAPLMVLFDASASSSPQNNNLSFKFDFGDGVTANSQSGIVSHIYENVGTYTVTLTVTDSLGAQAQRQTIVTTTHPALPPAAEVQVPPALPDRPQSMNDSVSFLYSGQNPLQTGMQADFINPSRVAVVQGLVSDTNDQPISGVKVKILEMPEVGETLTDVNGKFYLAVNGGGMLTVDYRRNGYFPVQRKVQTSPLDYFSVEKIQMLRPDSKVTQVTMNSANPQVVRGSAVTDQSGSRTATLMIPPGVTAKLQMPNGSLKPVSTLSLRATEYTVGSDGPKRMPAYLPPTTAYTYAVELAADEAIANGAEHILFSSPVPFYVNNFLNFDVGISVPHGTYNLKSGSWDAERDGIVVKVIAVNDGQAVLDVTGTGISATQAQLDRLAVTPTELTQIASLFSVGDSFWRARLEHLSTVDLNFPLSISAVNPPDANIVAGAPNNCPEDFVTCGSLIGVNQQSLGETIELPGLPFNLNYTSRGAKGRTTERTLTIPVHSGNLPTSNSFTNFLVKIEIAGQVHERNFVPASNLIYKFEWDGKDVFGRDVYDSTNARVTIDYQGSGFYILNRFSFPLDLKTFDQVTANAILSTIPSRSVGELRRVFNIPVIAPRTKNNVDIGGWGLDQVHRYDPTAKILKLGNGGEVDASKASPILSRIAGNLPFPGTPSADGVPALSANLGAISSIVTGPDDTIYFVEVNSNRIKKINSSGNIETVAGNGNSGIPLENELAINTPICVGSGSSDIVIAQDNSIFLSCPSIHKIYKIGADGRIRLFAGTTHGFSGDGGPALSAQLQSPMGMALSPDGTLYFADNSNHRIRKITATGIISTVGGNGSITVGTGSENALTVGLSTADVAYGLNGEIYFVEQTENAVYAIYPDGILKRFAGSSNSKTANQATGDGGPAINADLYYVTQIVTDKKGRVYTKENDRIRVIKTDGTIETLAGGRDLNGPFNGVQYTNVYAAFSVYLLASHIAIYGDDKLLTFGFNGTRIYVYQPALPSLNLDGYSIGSKDATEIYQFNGSGVHQKTLYAKTGKIKWNFGYDADGRLISVTDGSGKTTTITRDANGKPISLRGHFGHTFSLSTDANGNLTSVTNPSNETTRMTYTNAGLLESFKKPNGAESTFDYNLAGELIKDTNAVGGFTTLVKNIMSGSSYRITQQTALGRTSVLQVEMAPQQNRFKMNYPDSSEVTQFVSPFLESVADNHGESTTTSGPDVDPRLGGISQFFIQEQRGTYGGIPINSSARHVDFTPLSATDFFKFKMEEVVRVGTVATSGPAPLIITSSYDSPSKTLITTSDTGRTQKLVYDDQERVISFKNGNLSPVESTYNSLGQLTKVQQGNRISTFTYNTLGQLSTTTNPENQTSTFGWDVSDRLISKTEPNGKTTLFGYNLNSKLNSVTPPDSMLHSLVGDLLDLFSVYTPPALSGISPTSYTYNLDKQLTKKVKPDGSSLIYTYDPSSGRVTSLTGPNQTINFNYSSTQRSPSLFTTNNGIVVYNFGQAEIPMERYYYFDNIPIILRQNYGLQLTLTDVRLGNQILATYGYNKEFLMTKAGDLMITREPANGFMTGTQMGVVEESFGYNSFGEVESVSAIANSTPIFSQIYSRDRLGRISGKTETILGTVTSYAYTYDLSGRLTDVYTNGNLSNHYAYSGNGNRVEKNSVAATYDAQDRIVQSGSTFFTHDANGNLTKKQIGTDITTYAYDDFDKLLSITLPNNTIVSYLNDGELRRVVKIVNEIPFEKYVYHQDGRLAGVFTPNHTLKSYYVYGTQPHSPDYVIKGSNKYRLLKDQLGSIRLVVNVSDGSIAQRLDYDEFGNVTLDTNPGFQSLGYAAGLYDPDTGLVRFGARDYDPTIGRWTSKDPIGFIGGSTNLYTYASANPINKIDPSGLCDMEDYMNVNAEVNRLGAEAMQQISDVYSLFTGTALVAVAAAAAPEAASACMLNPALCSSLATSAASGLISGLTDGTTGMPPRTPADYAVRTIGRELGRRIGGQIAK